MRACDYHLYEIDYLATVAERAAEPGGINGETVATGRTYTEQRRYRCVAPTAALAEAAFVRYHPAASNERLGVFDRGVFVSGTYYSGPDYSGGAKSGWDAFADAVKASYAPSDKPSWRDGCAGLYEPGSLTKKGNPK